MTDALFKSLYREAEGCLLRVDGFTEPKIERPESHMAITMEDVYRCLLDALLSTKRMREAIGPVDALGKHLFGFNPIKTIARYADQHDKLLQKIKGKSYSTEDNKQKKYIEDFCMGALSGASFLKEFGIVETFRAFVIGFQYDEMTMAVLPLLLQKEIQGLGFQAACTFLNNTGFPQYVSPDPKVKSLFMDIGIAESMDNYEALKTLIIIARANEEPVAAVHRVFWMIANGKVTEDGDKDPRLRKEYLDFIIKKLFGQSPT